MWPLALNNQRNSNSVLTAFNDAAVTQNLFSHQCETALVPTYTHRKAAVGISLPLNDGLAAPPPEVRLMVKTHPELFLKASQPFQRPFVFLWRYQGVVS